MIAGQIVEKVSGEPLMQFLEEHIFHPLEMKEVWNSDVTKLGETDAAGYIRYALGPLRPAPKEGRGWMFAAGELAMPAYDLAQWDISVMDRSLLQAKSYDEMETAVQLKDGSSSHYGLGMFVRDLDGHEELEHSGEVSGFVAENMVFPKDKVAIAVLTNQDASRAAGVIGRELAPLLLGVSQTTPTAAEAQAQQLLENFQQGKIDRSLFTPWCNAYFDEQALAGFSNQPGAAGQPSRVQQMAEDLRGGMTFRVFRVEFAERGEAGDDHDVHGAGREAGAVPGVPGQLAWRRRRSSGQRRKLPCAFGGLFTVTSTIVNNRQPESSHKAGCRWRPVRAVRRTVLGHRGLTEVRERLRCVFWCPGWGKTARRWCGRCQGRLDTWS